MFLQKFEWWHCSNTYWVESLMFNKILTLFIIARKLALSDALKIISKKYEIPIIIKIFVNLLSISFSKKKKYF